MGNLLDCLPFYWGLKGMCFNNKAGKITISGFAC